MVGLSSRWRSVFSCAPGFLLISSGALAQVPAATLRPIGSVESERIVWSRQEPEVELQGQGDQLQVPLEGCVQRDHLSLVHQERTVPMVGRQGRCFRLEVPLRGEETPVKLTFVADDGTTTESDFVIQLAGFAKVLEEMRKPRSRLSVSGTVSGMLSHYTETSATPITGMKLAPALGVAYDLVPGKWTAILDGAVDTVVVAPRPANKWNRFLRVDLGAGYRVQRVILGNTLEIRAGIQQTQMWVSEETFGFVGVTALELYPVIRRRLSGGDELSLDLRYSPIFSGLGFKSPLDSRRIDVKLMWSREEVWRNWPLMVSLRYENLAVKIDASSILHQALWLGVGTSWGR